MKYSNFRYAWAKAERAERAEKLKGPLPTPQTQLEANDVSADTCETISHSTNLASCFLSRAFYQCFQMHSGELNEIDKWDERPGSHGLGPPQGSDRPSPPRQGAIVELCTHA